MYVIVWRYSVPVERNDEFVRAYGPDGDWSQLFRTAPGYEGTELVGCDDGQYMTIDRWLTSDAFGEFMAASREQYETLDAALAALTTEEVLVGRGTTVGST